MAFPLAGLPYDGHPSSMREHVSGLQEAAQCVEELELGPQLHVFVRVGVESTLERSQITREHMGVLLLQLLQQGPLPKGQFLKGSVLPPASTRPTFTRFGC